MAIDMSQLAAVLDGTSSVYVAIRTQSGPHLTPELFTVSGGRVLCLTSVVTLKARRARTEPIVAICAWHGDRALTALGDVEVIDPAVPTSVLAAPGTALQSPLGVARFLRDNAAEMTGAAIDLVAGRLGRPIPPHRVILAIKPVAATISENGDVTMSDGWDLDPDPVDDGEPDAADEGDDDGEPDAADEGEAVDLRALPDGLATLAVAGPAAVGWMRPDGTPLALPAMWDPARREALVPEAVFDLGAGVDRGPACVTFDAWSGYGPSGKQGVMLRGVGRASRDDGSVRLAIDIDRASHWDGVETGTVDLDPTAPG
ncbi:MAG: hypothetical protein ABWZ76_07750 [Acidimicrobiales bacterium]